MNKEIYKITRAFGLALLIVISVILFIGFTMVLAKIITAHPMVGWCLAGLCVLICLTKMCYEMLYSYSSD